MLVTFNPMINTSATTEAAYANFLRCVTSVMTAAVGAVAGTANSTPTTTNLSVVPYLNNTGSTDVSKNCIISVDASTEAGGWTTSSAHNVPSSATFNAYGTTQWRADFYNASGKATYPYNKVTFHGGLYTGAVATPATPTNYLWSSASTYNESISGHASVPGVAMTIGCSANSAWTAADTYTPIGGTTAINSGTQTTSYTLAGWSASTTSSTSNPYNQWGFIASQTGLVYKMAVTANYCIVWAQSATNSYASGYNNSWYPLGHPGNTTTKPIYGHILYGGLRETQAWENSSSNNPPWCAMSYVSSASATTAGGSYTSPYLPNSFAGYMLTLNNSGVASGSATRYGNWNQWTTREVTFGANYATIETSPYQQLNTRPFNSTNDGNSVGLGTTNFLRLPTTDSSTGALVPSAAPIIMQRSYSAAWTPGGALRGLYKSMSVPLATFKLYWGAANQTFTIGNDQYIPIVINEEMWLVRYA